MGSCQRTIACYSGRIESGEFGYLRAGRVDICGTTTVIDVVASSSRSSSSSGGCGGRGPTSLILRRMASRLDFCCCNCRRRQQRRRRGRFKRSVKTSTWRRLSAVSGSSVVGYGRRGGGGGDRTAHDWRPMPLRCSQPTPLRLGPACSLWSVQSTCR